MSHFLDKRTSPFTAISIGTGYMVVMTIVLQLCGFYSNNSFFAWGPPLRFFGKDVTDNTTFYILLFMLFFHQLINNHVGTVVYPWMLNSIQDPKNKQLEYSKPVSLGVIFVYNLYSEIDVVFVISGFTSQISFFIVIILANSIMSMWINNIYINKKNDPEVTIGEIFQDAI